MQTFFTKKLHKIYTWVILSYFHPAH